MPRIVCVDDDSSILLLVKTVLSHKLSAQVDTAASVEEARQVLNNTPPPDLVLLDLMMPGVDGYLFCRELKDSPGLKAVPVVFLSAVDELDPTRVQTAGALSLIKKPFTARTLCEQVRRLLEPPHEEL